MKVIELERKDLVEDLLWWQKKGLSYTYSGYGAKLPTSWKTRHNGRLKRIYCSIFSNSGTLYLMSHGEKVIVHIY